MTTWEKITNSALVKKWSALLSIVLSPGFLISGSATILCLWLSVYYKSNIPFSNMMAILGSVFGGINGAFVKDEYDRISNKNLLEKKGRSALRNLEGIRTQLKNIECWIEEFRTRSTKKEEKTTLEEISRHVATIDSNIYAGLEDWVDIIPELKERSQNAAVIDQKYKEATQSVVIELLEKRKELATAKDKKLSTELKSKISDLEKQVLEIKRDRSSASNGLVWGSNKAISFSGEPVTLSQSIDSNFGKLVCTKCGKKFYPDINHYLQNGVMTLVPDHCEKCKNAK